jgi:hypothetical protein
MRISSEAATRGEESGARIQESGEAVVRRTVEIIGPSDATYLRQNNWRGAALARASRPGCVSLYRVLRQGNVKAGGSPQVARPTHTHLAPGSSPPQPPDFLTRSFAATNQGAIREVSRGESWIDKLHLR